VGAAADERDGPHFHGMVNARRALGAPLAFGVALSLVCGIAGGLLRAGIPLDEAAWIGRAAAWHAALMMGAFFGAVIGVERAVAARHAGAWLAPAGAALAGGCLVAGKPDAAALLLVLASAAFVAVNVLLWRRQRAAHTALLVASAIAWGIGNLLFAAHATPPMLLPWWFAFLVVTIAAERLEMTRLARRAAGTQALLFVVLGTLGSGAMLSAFDAPLGGAVFGAALAALALWLVAFDIAWRTVRSHGLPRYMALCLLAGYAWLFVGGVCWAATAVNGFARDAALHAIGLGFVFSMVMAHAPVILPAVARIKVSFGVLFYVPAALLHGSLAWRLGAGFLDGLARTHGAGGNALAIGLFALVMAGAALRWRQQHHTAAGVGRSH
jgi:hypothetical protein